MTDRMREVSSKTLDALANLAAVGGSLSSVRRLQLVPADERDAVAALLWELEAEGLSSGVALSCALRLAARARRTAEDAPRPQLVWSAHNLAGAPRTVVVVRDLFKSAEQTIVLSTFSIGHWADEDEPPHNPVLEPLAERMNERPELKVRLFLNIKRPEALVGAPAVEVERDFTRKFLRYWPAGARFPDIYYDPRSLERKDAVLHAKCIVVDDRSAFLTSANLTEAAYQQNIEAGVRLDDPPFARLLREQFDALIDAKLVKLLALRR